MSSASETTRDQIAAMRAVRMLPGYLGNFKDCGTVTGYNRHNKRRRNDPSHERCLACIIADRHRRINREASKHDNDSTE